MSRSISQNNEKTLEKATKNSVKSYKSLIRFKWITLIVLACIIVAIALFAIGAGSSGLSVDTVIKTLFGFGDKASNNIVFQLRLPRVITALVAGFSLAISGCVMQAVLRNPLASASTLGVSQGASFGATVAIILLGAGTQNTVSAANAVAINNPYVVTLCAFIGGSISTAIILGLSFFKKMGPGAMVLAGVALSALFSGATTLIQYFANDIQVAAVVFWTFGDLGRTNWTEILIMSVCMFLSLLYFILNRWNYNAIGSGAATAHSLGVNVKSVTLVSMAICSLVAAVSVAFCGIISFIGLVAPHIIRRFVGDDYRFLVPASALTGSALLLLSDTFGRLIVAPIILPIGAITSFLGAPMFLYLLFKGINNR